MSSKREDLQKQWAFEGAAVRLARLRNEMNEILKTFPELRGQELRPRGLAPQAKVSPRQSRRGTLLHKPKRVFSPAGKRAISDGMRKYWAKRRAQAKTSKHAD